jgi:hypothetical protein
MVVGPSLVPFREPLDFFSKSSVFLDVGEDDRCDNSMGHPQYLAVPCFGILYFSMLLVAAHPRSGCRTSRWVSERPCMTAIYYAQKAEISSSYLMTLLSI